MSNSAHSVIRITGGRLFLAAMLSTALLTLRCLAENYLDEAYYTKWYVQVETQRLAEHIKIIDGKATLNSTSGLDFYSRDAAQDYGYKIWNSVDPIVMTSNDALMAMVSPGLTEQGRLLPDVWLRKTSPTWFHVTGGRRFEIQGVELWIEVATRGDPLGLRYRALFLDFMHDVLIPLTPPVFLSALLAWLSLRRTLSPLTTIADVARNLQPDSLGQGIRIKGLPREFADVVGAYNAILGQIGKLITSQQEFMGRAAHQLRMPLSIMMLEVEKSEHEFARKISNDLSGLGNLVDRMLEYSRLQASTDLKREDVDLVELCLAAQLDLHSLIQTHKSEVTIVDGGDTVVFAEGIAVREALRNLLANAVVHNIDHTKIRIVCGPGAQLSIEDDGKGLQLGPSSDPFAPFFRGTTSATGFGLGLAIVKQVMDLHGGLIDCGTSELGGARFRLRFPASPASGLVGHQ